MQFGEPLYRFDVLTSTQDVAREMARQGATPGTTVIADTMTAGRGRQGRVWVTPPGCNVCLTTIGPPVPLDRVWEIGMVAGTASGLAVRRFAPTANLRFPNDVYLVGRKVCGTLVETVAVPGGKDVVPLIGIGINVRRPETPLPPDIAARAISIEEATSRLYSVPEVEAETLARLSEVWNEWETNGFGKGFARTLERWRPLHDENARRTYVLDGEPVSCRLVSLKPDGLLTLETETGDIRRSIHAAQVILGDD